MEKLIAGQLDRQVCIIGNLNIDLIIRNVPCLPQWGQEVLGDDYLIVSSGQAAYTAFALRKLGIQTGIVGNVGDDLYGQKIISELKNAQIETSQIEVTGQGKTGISVAIARPDGERAFVSDTACLKKFDTALIERHLCYVQDSSLILMNGLFFLPNLQIPELKSILAQSKREGKTILLDTGWDPGNWQPQTLQELSSLLQEVSIFIPNMDEARAITGLNEPASAAAKIKDMGPEMVIIKLGAEGSFALTDKDSLHIRPHLVKAFDAVGAGDVFNAGFILGLLQGWPLQAMMEFGNSAAAAYISKKTDRFATYAEVAGLAKTYHTYDYL
jgi:sugar/nucleoside kinase (ribokinase family)